MQNKSNIAVLGCGWLGLPLAEILTKKGSTVKGSTTTIEKTETLAERGIHPFLISISEDKIEGTIAAFLEGSETLIINIPPKLRYSEPENFTQKIQLLLPYIEESTVTNVLFVSSISVYADSTNIHDKVTESYPTIPETENGRQLVAAEQLLQNNLHFKTTVLRFGGLIGKERHPVKHLAGKENLENPDAPINMIHLEDCIGIISKIIETKSWGETFNAVSPYHPTRAAYYHKKAQELNLALPKFVSGKPSVGKRISSENLQQALKYSFQKTSF